MGLCNRCRNILPPTMMLATEKGEQICAFCKTGKSTITLEDEHGNFKRFTKQEAIGKYKEFTDNVMRNEKLKKLLVQDDKKLII